MLLDDDAGDPPKPENARPQKQPAERSATRIAQRRVDDRGDRRLDGLGKPRPSLNDLGQRCARSAGNSLGRNQGDRFGRFKWPRRHQRRNGRAIGRARFPPFLRMLLSARGRFFRHRGAGHGPRPRLQVQRRQRDPRLVRRHGLPLARGNSLRRLDGSWYHHWITCLQQSGMRIDSAHDA